MKTQHKRHFVVLSWNFMTMNCECLHWKNRASENKQLKFGYQCIRKTSKTKSISVARKEIMKIRAEVDGIETKRTINRIMN